jgi:hypothetical protein
VLERPAQTPAQSRRAFQVAAARHHAERGRQVRRPAADPGAAGAERERRNEIRVHGQVLCVRFAATVAVLLENLDDAAQPSGWRPRFARELMT